MIVSPFDSNRTSELLQRKTHTQCKDWEVFPWRSSEVKAGNNCSSMMINGAWFSFISILITMHTLWQLWTQSLMVMTEADCRGDSLDKVGHPRQRHLSVTSGFQPRHLAVWQPSEAGVLNCQCKVAYFAFWCSLLRDSLAPQQVHRKPHSRISHLPYFLLVQLAIGSRSVPAPVEGIWQSRDLLTLSSGKSSTLLPPLGHLPRRKVLSTFHGHFSFLRIILQSLISLFCVLLFQAPGCLSWVLFCSMPVINVLPRKESGRKAFEDLEFVERALEAVFPHCINFNKWMWEPK